MRGEAPEDVFLAPNSSEIEAIRIEVLDSTEGAFVNQLLHLEEAGVVLEKVSNHEDLARSSGLGAQALGIGKVGSQRLFDEDVLAGRKRFGSQFVMSRGGRGDYH